LRADELEIVFVSGLSGSGKTTAMAAFEDLGFYCVDNLPPQLIEQFLDLCAKSTPPIPRIALAVDARERQFLRRLPEVVRNIREEGARVEVVFLDCANDVLQRRYRETRRVHPLSPDGSVEQGIESEREVLADVAALASVRIDTSALNVHQLKQTVTQQVTGGEARRTVVNLISFGFRYETPRTAELLFDLRFLPNPYFEERLRSRTGHDPEVAAFVLESERGKELFSRLSGLLDFLLPLYDAEGKAYVTIGLGCTGGRHRSVALALALGEWLGKQGREVQVEHRDAEREQ
jgi:UPF0042 nucleotide-binding protein